MGSLVELDLALESSLALAPSQLMQGSGQLILTQAEVEELADEIRKGQLLELGRGGGRSEELRIIAKSDLGSFLF